MAATTITEGATKNIIPNDLECANFVFCLLCGLNRRLYRGDRCVTVTALAAEHEHDCFADDLKVKPERRIADIPLIEGVLFFGGDELSTIHLRPPSYPGSDHQPRGRVRWLVVRQ